MDIPAVSIQLSANKAASSVGVSMMKKANEQTEQEGNQLIQLIQSATIVPPSPGSTFDVRI